jgi:hypothetical protein
LSRQRHTVPAYVAPQLGLEAVSVEQLIHGENPAQARDKAQRWLDDMDVAMGRMVETRRSWATSRPDNESHSNGWALLFAGIAGWFFAAWYDARRMK